MVERPVFAATTPARPRALRLAGRTAAGLVGLWLVALVLGAFGFGHVPGIQLPRILGEDGGGAHAVRAKPAPVRHANRSGVTLGRHLGSGTPATGAQTARRPAAHGGPSSGGSGRTGGSVGSTRGGGTGVTGGGPTRTPAQAGGGAQAPATAAPPAAGSAPPASTTSPSPSSNSSNSQATPRGSSSSAPGSRSQAGTAPGREHSSASPSPGQGAAEHKPPKG